MSTPSRRVCEVPVLDIFDIIRERPLTETPDDEATCPYCDAKQGHLPITGTTCLGWFGSVNPNHR
jgi:hypothetical protein